MELLAKSARLLQRSGYTTATVPVDGTDALAFEDTTVIGFVFQYDDVPTLLSSWDTDARETIGTYQFGLRRAAKKAWNLYTIFVSTGSSHGSQAAALSAIEEDLAGTRKIARAGVCTSSDVRDALLPLLPLQAPPHMVAVDIMDEIRQRTTEVEPRVLQAFFSRSDTPTILNILEDQP